nr:MAG TPA: hypothetical protein [Bacteriophage sp.]
MYQHDATANPLSSIAPKVLGTNYYRENRCESCSTKHLLR